jgi:hypothetical protein
MRGVRFVSRAFRVKTNLEVNQSRAALAFIGIVYSRHLKDLRQIVRAALEYGGIFLEYQCMGQYGLNRPIQTE